MTSEITPISEDLVAADQPPDAPAFLANGRYQIVARLGQGGMADVYKAYQESLDRYVAIKIMRATLAEDPDFQRRFHREAQMVATLRHPNIVQVHDYDQEGSLLYMALEFIDGPTLKDRLDLLAQSGERLAFSETLAIVRDVGDALTHAHQRGVIHRDVKPANILLDQDSRAYLADFGLGAVLGSARAAASGGLTGSLHYVSPEQILGRRGDIRSDIYSLGVLLFQMATGCLPFVADKPMSIILMHLHEPPPRPRSLNPELSPALERLILRALAKDPEDRYQSVAGMLADLDNLPSELAEDAAPRLATATTMPGNLPPQITPFIGRQQEVEDICALLRQETIRLLTLTGPGGAGKTRLSLQAAATLQASFRDGVYFIPLASLNDPTLTAPTIAQTLGIKESGGRPALEMLSDYLRGRQILLVLDNFEQILTAAPLAAELLTAAPGLKLLVTSRSPLQIYGEQEFPVPPLALPKLKPLPPLEELADFPAIALFTARAQAVKPAFHLTAANAAAVAEICHRLDGLPLAIELAAARSKLLSPQAMLTRLNDRLGLLISSARDLPARQQTLRGAIDWSYDLLDKSEKKLFAGLAVFVGGRTIEAVEAVLGDAGQRESAFLSVLDGLSSLLNKSLLWLKEGADGEPRFMMMETIHEYAWERLVASGEAARWQRRHARYFLDMAEAAGPELQGARQLVWINKLEAEHDNFRTALAWTMKNPEQELETAVRLCGALWRFWMTHGHLGEGLHWLAEAIRLIEQADPQTIPPEIQANVLNGAGSLAYHQGDYRRARRFYEQSLALNRQCNHQRGIAVCLNNLGLVSHDLALYAEAKALLDECLSLGKTIGDQRVISAVLDNRSLVAYTEGDYELADSVGRQSLELRRELGDTQWIAITQNILGMTAHALGKREEAAARHEESLQLFRKLGDQLGIARVTNNLGWVRYSQGAYEQALSLQQESLKLFYHLGERRGVARSLEGWAAALLAQNQAALAARLLGAATALREQIEAPLTPAERPRYERVQVDLRAQLDQADLSRHWSEGQALPLAQILLIAETAVPPS